MKRDRPKDGKSMRRMARRDPNRYPKGWDRKRVEAVISHYENQSDSEAIAEDEGTREGQ